MVDVVVSGSVLKGGRGEGEKKTKKKNSRQVNIEKGQYDTAQFFLPLLALFQAARPSAIAVFSPGLLVAFQGNQSFIPASVPSVDAAVFLVKTMRKEPSGSSLICGPKNLIVRRCLHCSKKHTNLVNEVSAQHAG